MSRPLCVIVGAGEGLGRALAVKFAKQDYDLALISRSRKGCTVAMDAALEANRNVSVCCFRADVTKPQTLESSLDRIDKEIGEIDLLIYNVRAAFTASEPLEMTYEDLEENFRLEVVGAFAAAKAVLPKMIDRGRGSIFFSSATAAFRGSGRFPLYAIGKFGLRGLSQSLAKAYAKSGIHIVHFRLDCDLDVPIMQELYGDQYNPEKLAQPADVADTYWLTYQQPRGAWSNEVEIRPYNETWTY